MVDLHRHDEFSTFDGFGKPEELAVLAKSLGHTSFSTTNHGTVANWIQHYNACKDAEIKPILGVEAYFKPVPEIEGRGFHLCLFAKNKRGYYNINRLMLKGEKNKYYNPIITFEDLENCSDGVIVSSACIASYSSQMILKGNKTRALKYFGKMKEIFGDDFYVEIQPYKIDDKKTQEKIDFIAFKMANSLGIKCVLTSDSHYGSKDDFDSYLKMHDIAKHDKMDIVSTYGERYMPTEEELKERFIQIYGNKIADSETIAKELIKNLEEIENKIDSDILSDTETILPVISDDSKKLIKQKVISGLKKRDKYIPEYIERCKFELDVIDHLGYNDYFLMVADYVNWAKNNDIAVGPGRGSCCNSLVCWALEITDVDSLFFNLEFSRFLRKDKKKMPDIDLDFETCRRDEVLDYLLETYKGHAAQVGTYGLYKIDNLINDLAKVCGLSPIDKEISAEEKAEREQTIREIKRFINQYKTETDVDLEHLKRDPNYKIYNRRYENIIKHFCKLYRKIRYYGTHAAGVAITGENILKKSAIKKAKNKVFTYYDLNDLDKIGVVKFDILGLITMEELHKLRVATNTFPDYESLTNDKKLIKNFREGNTIGVFQFESSAARDILAKVNADCFDDIVAVNAMNRPGPLSLHQPEEYAQNKKNIAEAKNKLHYQYTKESYGTIVFQEQIQAIAVNIGKLTWDEADKIMKMMKGGAMSVAMKEDKELVDGMRKRFVKGAIENGMEKTEAKDLFDSIITYSFNKGHAVGYSLISIEEMFYKINYPVDFWCYKLRMTNPNDSTKMGQYRAAAVQDGCIIFKPHVNGTARVTTRKVDGERIIQDGLISIKGVGLKAAQTIEKYGPYVDFPDFEEKLSEMPKEEKRTVTKKVIDILKKAGAFEFSKKKYIQECTDYNLFLYRREINIR